MNIGIDIKNIKIIKFNKKHNKAENDCACGDKPVDCVYDDCVCDACSVELECNDC